MIDGLKPYPAYKDSGSEWIGEIPAHWNVMPLKHWVCINSKVLPENTPADYEFYYLDIASIGTGVLVAAPERINFASAPSRARRIVSAGDTIVSTVRTYLNATLFISSASQLICSTGFAVLSPTAQTVPKFISYFVRSSAFTDNVSSQSTGVNYPGISETRVARTPIVAPTPDEQKAISRFLAHADALIHRYIAAKRREIKLLEEQKQVIVDRAVMHGLGKHVQMKRSGLDWIEKIPVHWRVERNYALFRQRHELNLQSFRFSRSLCERACRSCPARRPASRHGRNGR